jgi:TonB-linked SusC/RagA family outer membrane protein
MLINRQASDTIAREKNSVSYFGRATYNFKDKYIINGVFRASGASQLASGKKWGYFPGISAAWIISNENFLKNITMISELKIRGGWGQTGNISGVDYYSSYGLLGDDHGTLQNYLNTDLTWETTTDINIGLDVALLKNRIKLAADIYQKTTTDLINKIYISGIAYTYNAGKLQNKGVEFLFNSSNFKNGFKWNTNFNISFVKNKILEMGLQPIEYAGYQNVNRYEKGVSLGNFYGYVVDQVNPTTGILEYKDLNGDGIITPQDRTIIGNAIPDYTFGLTNTFSYKGISLDVLFTGTQGNDIFNASRIDLEGMIDSKNQSAAVLNRWQQEGDITNIPRANDPTSTFVSDRWVEDGSYVRLKSITIAYNFKSKFLRLDSLKFYATGQNLVTWTKYSGFDPEVNSSSSNSGTAQGIDYGTYPQVRTFIFGLKAGF